jgi:hypothetical protein
VTLVRPQSPGILEALSTVSATEVPIDESDSHFMPNLAVSMQSGYVLEAPGTIRAGVEFP